MNNEKAALPGAALSEETAAKPLFELHSTATTDETAGEQLRRRRQASLRCEPLADGTGRRDPWSRPRATPARTLHVEVGRRTAWLFGDKTFALLDAVGLERRQWDASRRVWMIPMQYADDVMAYAEWKQRRVVTCTAVDR